MNDLHDFQWLLPQGCSEKLFRMLNELQSGMVMWLCILSFKLQYTGGEDKSVKLIRVSKQIMFI